MRILHAFVVALLFVVPAVADEAKLLQTANALYQGVRTETLPNGLRVFLKPVPGSPVVTTMVAYKVGSCDEDLDHTHDVTLSLVGENHKGRPGNASAAILAWCVASR